MKFRNYLIGVCGRTGNQRLKFLSYNKKPLQGALVSCVSENILASRLVATADWWKYEKRQVWEREKEGIPLPLREWALLEPALTLGAVKTRSIVYKTIGSIWVK